MKKKLFFALVLFCWGGVTSLFAADHLPVKKGENFPFSDNEVRGLFYAENIYEHGKYFRGEGDGKFNPETWNPDPFNRQEFIHQYLQNKSGRFSVNYGVAINVKSYVDETKVHKCEKRVDKSEIFDSRSDAERYLQNNPSTKCQTGEIKTIDQGYEDVPDLDGCDKINYRDIYKERTWDFVKYDVWFKTIVPLKYQCQQGYLIEYYAYFCATPNGDLQNGGLDRKGKPCGPARDKLKEKKQITKRVKKPDKYQVEYTFKPEAIIKEGPDKGKGRLVLIDGKTFNSDVQQLYDACYWHDPYNKDGKLEDLKMYKYWSYLFRWDRDPPKCVPGIQDENFLKLLSHSSAGKFDNDEAIIRNIRNNNKTSITYDVNATEYWNGTWTNRDLYFTGMCDDIHSGCHKDLKNQGIFTGKNKLRNRQREYDFTSGRNRYTDNVNNQEEKNVCDVSLQYLKEVKRGKYTFGGKDYYIYMPFFENKKDDDGTAPKIYPLIDKTNPTISAKPTTKETIDNPSNTKTQQDSNWSFYAGKIGFDLDIRDSKGTDSIGTDSIGFGVSGLKAVKVDILDQNNRSIFPNSSEVDAQNIHNGLINATQTSYSIPEEMERRTNPFLDDTPSVFAGKYYEVKIIKPGTYKLRISAVDHAGNSINKDFSFSVVENHRWKEDGQHTFTFHATCEKAERCQERQGITSFAQGNEFCQNDRENTAIGHVCISSKNTLDKYYADANSHASFDLIFYDKYFNILKQKKIRSIDAQNNAIIKLNQVDENPQGDNQALFYKYKNAPQSPVNYVGMTDNDGKESVKIFSYAPGEVSANFAGTLCFWDTFGRENCAERATPTSRYQINWAEDGKKMKFLHPLTAKLKLPPIDRVFLGATNNIRLSFKKTEWPNFTIGQNVFDYHIKEIMSSLVPWDTSKKDPSNPDGIPSTSMKISERTQTNDQLVENFDNIEDVSGKFILEQIDFKARVPDNLSVKSSPYADFELDGLAGRKKPKYYIVDRNDNFGKGIVFEQGKLNTIYIKGYKQAIGKEQFVTDQINLLSEKFSPHLLRSKILRNVSYLTRNRQPDGEIVNGIKYVSGTEPGMQLSAQTGDWNTLIVKDGNLIIDEDFNTEKKNKAIIVISTKNNYSIDDWKKSGNIFIKPNVKFVGATIYADRSLISVDERGESFKKSDAKRAEILENQIVFYGKIFSQNTIGGAVLGNNNDKREYILPSLMNPKNLPAEVVIGDEVNNLDKAVMYDLSFLRMNNENSNPNINEGRKEFTVILDNPEASKNPLLIFDFRE